MGNCMQQMVLGATAKLIKAYGAEVSCCASKICS